MGLLAEHFADEKGLVWPAAIAPFKIYLAGLGEDGAAKAGADEVYESLKSAHISVLYDDRDERPGEKFADADLLGIPYRAVVSEKSLQAGGVELKKRSSTDIQIIPLGDLAAAIPAD
jgi:prolyl-tRNA synthetase